MASDRARSRRNTSCTRVRLPITPTSAFWSRPCCSSLKNAERRCEHVRPCGISLNLQACFWHNGLQHLKAASEVRSEYYGPQRTAWRFLS